MIMIMFHLTWCLYSQIYLSKKTFDYIIHKIYTEKVIERKCWKSIFKKLLIKLTKRCCNFSVNNLLIKESDGCPMGGLKSVVFVDIYMCKMEDDVGAPVTPLFYKGFADGSYSQFHNILKLFDVLPNFSFTTSETRCDYYL